MGKSNARKAAKAGDVVKATNLPLVRDDRFVDVYSNLVYIAKTPDDIRMIFCQIEILDEDNSCRRIKAAVNLSPRHALRLYHFLGQHLNEWDEKFSKYWAQMEEIKDPGFGPPATREEIEL